MIWFYPDNIEIAGKWVFPQYWNSQQPLWVIWYHGKVLIHHIAGLYLGFMSSYCANEGIFAFQYGGNILFPWYHVTQRGCCKFQYALVTLTFPLFTVCTGTEYNILYLCIPWTKGRCHKIFYWIMYQHNSVVHIFILVFHSQLSGGGASRKED